LYEKGKTLAIANSCTGRITYIPNMFLKFFEIGYIFSTTQTKIDFLGISKEKIDDFGDVSEKVATLMAENTRQIVNTKLALSTTGFVGPEGGTDVNPTGTIYVSFAIENADPIAHRFFFPYERKRFKQFASSVALELLPSSP